MIRSAADEGDQSNPKADSQTVRLTATHPQRDTWRSLLERDFERLSVGRRVSGWIRRTGPRELLYEFAKDPESFISSPRATILRDRPKSKLFRCAVEGSDSASQDLVVKRVRYESWFRRLGFMFAASPALRSLRGALILQASGIDTPLPVAALDERSWEHLGTSYYIAEEVEDGQSLRALWQTTWPALPRMSTFGMRRQVLRDVASLFQHLHSRGIFHQDLKGTNILLQSEAGGHRLLLVDVGDVRQPRRLLPQNRLRNLTQICEIPGRFWRNTERAVFLKQYTDLSGLSKSDRHALIDDVVRAIARKNKGGARAR